MNNKPKKQRLDQVLVDKALAPSRSQARSLIMAGKVLVNDEVVDKAGSLIFFDDDIRLKNSNPYVSRGGFKLAKALHEFNINVRNKSCLDIGQSTGGFTDCLLQNGAKKVFGIDVGYNQLHWKLQQDDRVVFFEKENFRHFDIKKLSEKIDLAVIDVSFISLKLIFPKLKEIFTCSPGEHEVIALIKPQFEAGKERVGKGGIVRDESIRQDVLEDITSFTQNLGFQNQKHTTSPITGTDGNVEFLLHAAFS